MMFFLTCRHRDTFSWTAEPACDFIFRITFLFQRSRSDSGNQKSPWKDHCESFPNLRQIRVQYSQLWQDNALHFVGLRLAGAQDALESVQRERSAASPVIAEEPIA